MKERNFIMGKIDTVTKEYLNRGPHTTTKKQFLEELQISKSGYTIFCGAVYFPTAPFQSAALGHLPAHGSMYFPST